MSTRETSEQLATIENPAALATHTQVRVRVPTTTTVRLTATSRLALTDVGSLFFTIFLSLAIGFGTAYYSQTDPPTSLRVEFLGWVALAALNLAVILYLRIRMYLEPTQTLTYQLAEGQRDVRAPTRVENARTTSRETHEQEANPTA